MSKTKIKVDDIVLLKNNKRFHWKGRKFSQNSLVLTLLWISLTKELQLWKTHGEWFLRINTALFNLNNTFKEQATNLNQHQMRNLKILSPCTIRNCWDDFAWCRSTIGKFFPWAQVWYLCKYQINVL